jgi:organic radical activating enzyme
MNSIFNKQVHSEEFKLRILVTDGCNYDCKFCLNDFQPKPIIGPKFLSVIDAKMVIDAYAELVRNKYPAQVYFSGGEPTIHPELYKMVHQAGLRRCRVTVNTNGSFTKDSSMFQLFQQSVNCTHISAYGKDERLAELAVALGIKNVSIQCVYSNRTPYVDADFLEFYMKYKLPIKIFGDMRENPRGYEAFASEVKRNYPEYDLSFRFTGVQQNRGQGCIGCNKQCVTLKAAWVFPDGGISFCPQREIGNTVYYPQSYSEWLFALSDIEKQHRRNVQ